MKKFLFVFFFTNLIHTQSLISASVIKTTSFEPCLMWIYDFDIQSYACRSRGKKTPFYSAEEIDKLKANLEQKISELEARVKKLEGN